MHRPKTSSTALMNACSAATVAGFGAPPLVSSACSDGTRSLSAALSSAVLQKRLAVGTAHRPAELLQHRRVHVARGHQRRGRLGTRHRRARSSGTGCHRTPAGSGAWCGRGVRRLATAVARARCHCRAVAACCVRLWRAASAVRGRHVAPRTSRRRRPWARDAHARRGGEVWRGGESTKSNWLDAYRECLSPGTAPGLVVHQQYSP